MNLVNGATRRKRLDVADTYLKKAIKIAIKTSSHELSVLVWTSVGNLELAKGNHQASIASLRKAAQSEEAKVGSSVFLAQIHECLANSLDEAGDTAQARASRTRALVIRHAKVPQSLETHCKKAPPT
jgi:tetratricopeptide (TPR) repeat protein